jgi:hypothetical protein
MNRYLTLSLALAGALALWALPRGAAPAAEFSPHVDGSGRISLPGGFRDWRFLGTWSIAGEEQGGGAAGFHNVYTQPATVAAYRATGRFPDGAVLVKELFKTRTGDYTTGRVSHAAEVKGWFVMVKDATGRFPGNPLWGKGWGWSLFKAAEPGKTVTTDYQTDCLGCHVPAENTDWIYVEGYPILKR